MINSISNTNTSALMTSKTSSLTTEQKKLVEETLSKYASDKLSEADAADIVNTFSTAGIQPGKDLESAMKASGFNARNVGDLARSGNRPPPPPESEYQNIDLKELVDYIEDYLSQVDEDSTTNNNLSLYENIKSHFGLDDNQSIINILV